MPNFKIFQRLIMHFTYQYHNRLDHFFFCYSSALSLTKIVIDKYQLRNQQLKNEHTSPSSSCTQLYSCISEVIYRAI